MQAMVSRPRPFGTSIPSRFSSRSSIDLLEGQVMTPTEPRAPGRCCGRGSAWRPALLRPTIPREAARLAIVRTLRVPCRWCVIPMHQPMTAFFAARYCSAMSRISAG